MFRLLIDDADVGSAYSLAAYARESIFGRITRDVGTDCRSEVENVPRRTSEKEPAWFKNRHCSMTEFKEKYGK